MNFDLTEEQKLIQDTARDFAREELEPMAAKLDQEKDRPALLANLKKLAELGFMGLNIKETYGGAEAGVVAFTSPQGNCLAVLDAATGNVRSVAPLREVCGVAADGKGFLATTGSGEVILPDGTDETRDVVFDNHILRLR